MFHPHPRCVYPWKKTPAVTIDERRFISHYWESSTSHPIRFAPIQTNPPPLSVSVSVSLVCDALRCCALPEPLPIHRHLTSRALAALSTANLSPHSPVVPPLVYRCAKNHQEQQAKGDYLHITDSIQALDSSRHARRSAHDWDVEPGFFASCALICPAAGF